MNNKEQIFYFQLAESMTSKVNKGLGLEDWQSDHFFHIRNESTLTIDVGNEREASMFIGPSLKKSTIYVIKRGSLDNEEITVRGDNINELMDNVASEIVKLIGKYENVQTHDYTGMMKNTKQAVELKTGYQWETKGNELFLKLGEWTYKIYPIRTSSCQYSFDGEKKKGGYEGFGVPCYDLEDLLKALERRDIIKPLVEKGDDYEQFVLF